MSFTSNEPGSTFECRLDGAAFSACTSPHQLTGLSEGPHTFQVRATDAAGNTDASPAQASFTVDTVAPETSITQAPASLINTTSTSVSFASNEPGSTFECRLDAAAFSACTSPRQLTGLSQGPHTFAVRARDPAGNIDPSPAQVSFTVDSVAPQTSITQAPAPLINTNSTSVSFTSSEAGSTFECRLDGAAFSACTSPHPLTNLGAGAHTFQVRATDPAGNTDPTPAQAAFTVNLTPAAPPEDPGTPTTGPSPPTAAIGGALPPAAVPVTRDAKPPVIVSARVTPNRFRTRPQVRVALMVRANEPGLIRAQIRRLTPGRRVAGRCRPTATAGPRCTRIVTVRNLARRTATGAATLPVAGPGMRRFAPGRYRARITATDAAGNRSAPRVVAFRVTR